MNAYSLDFRYHMQMSNNQTIQGYFNCGVNTVFKALRKLGYTYKKDKKSTRRETNQRVY